MINRAEIERLLNQTGRTLEGLPERYSNRECTDLLDSVPATTLVDATIEICNKVLHQSDVIELLVGALSDALDKQPTWISVEERLPEPKKEVLVCIRYNTGHVIRETAKYDEKYGDPWLTSNEDYYCAEGDPEITHWMPLPEPPKEGE